MRGHASRTPTFQILAKSLVGGLKSIGEAGYTQGWGYLTHVWV